MAKRIGKYKISKKESALSIADGGTIDGDVNLINDSHLASTGTVPTLTVTTAGDGTCTISAESTDVAGTVTFADTWANSDTLLVTFNQAYATAPKVILSSHVYNASGANVLEYDAVVATTAGFTITASGTCVGALTYFVIETV